MAVIVVSGLQGGVGANTVAANLAAVYSQLGKKTIVIDLCSKNLIGQWFAYQYQQGGWSQFTDQEQGWKLAIFHDCAGTYFIPFGNIKSGARKALTVFKQMQLELISKFEIIIVYCDPSFNTQAISASIDIKVVSPTPSSVLLLSQSLREKNQYEHQRYVLNLCRHDVSINMDMTLLIEELLCEKLFSSYLYYDIAVQEAYAQMGNIITAAPLSRMIKELKNLAVSCLDSIESQVKINGH